MKNNDNKSEVYFTRLTDPDDKNYENIQNLINQSDQLNFVKANDLVAVKVHVGEKGNITYIPPDYIKPIIESLKDKKAKPFLTDTNVLYHSARSNAVDHILLANEHNFSLENTGCPFITSDGLIGTQEVKVPINGKHYSSVPLAALVAETHGIVCLSHVTGHMITGYAGAIKNLGMGFSTRKGKLNQHSDISPFIKKDKCQVCGKCIEHCPVTAISKKEKHVSLDTKKCIGCGECLVICPYQAVGFNWRMSPQEIQEKMSEHALGVKIQMKDKITFINFLYNITKDCDCIGKEQQLITENIGVLSSNNPVALDKACYDMIKEKCGKTIENMTYPQINGQFQFDYSQEIGLGIQEYNLIEI